MFQRKPFLFEFVIWFHRLCRKAGFWTQSHLSQLSQLSARARAQTRFVFFLIILRLRKPWWMFLASTTGFELLSRLGYQATQATRKKKEIWHDDGWSLRMNHRLTLSLMVILSLLVTLQPVSEVLVHRLFLRRWLSDSMSDSCVPRWEVRMQVGS